MIIGAQKSGTTSLANQLAGHSDICFCDLKEPGYFNEVTDWKSRIQHYHALYRPDAGQLCGEASTMYTFIPEFFDTHQRLFEYNPALKFIYIMRNPVERIVSNYAHRMARKTTGMSPEQAVFADPVYVNRSRYAVQLRPYLELFPRENFLFLIFEEYIRDQFVTLREIAAFLGVDSEKYGGWEQLGNQHSTVGEYQLPPMAQKLHSNGAAERMLSLVPKQARTRLRQLIGNKLDEKPDFSPSLRQELWRLLEDDVREVENILGRDLKIWRSE